MANSITQDVDIVSLLASMAQMQQNFQEALERMSETPKSTTSFHSFDASVELWQDYLQRFELHCKAFGKSQQKSSYFLSCQNHVVFKQLEALAIQKKKDITSSDWSTIKAYMSEVYDPKKYVVKERYLFWSSMGRKTGESVQQLADRARRLAATCDFASVTDPLDEALKLWFICSIQSKDVLKSLLSKKEDELTFERCVEEASRIESTAAAAREAEAKPKQVNFVDKKNSSSNNSNNQSASLSTSSKPKSGDSCPCLACGRTGHSRQNCRYKNAVCNTCQIKGHISPACLKKTVKTIAVVSCIGVPDEKILETVTLEGKLTVAVELDSGSPVNIMDCARWQKLGSPSLCKDNQQLQSCTQHSIPIKGYCIVKVAWEDQSAKVKWYVTETPKLNVIGRPGIRQLQISLDRHMLVNQIDQQHIDFSVLQKKCQELANQFPEIFKKELGCLKDFELDIKFKSDFKPMFCKPRQVPLAMMQDVEEAIEVGIKDGIWDPVKLNDCGTPIVPLRKALRPGQEKPSIRICGDYSVFINKQLEPHRLSLPLPEDLMRKLKGGCGYSKIDLASAYNQIKLSPQSAQRLALSTHKYTLLQRRLPFGILSAPGYFQDIMNTHFGSLPGVAIYLDDVLVSGINADDHIKNLSLVFNQLKDLGLRCRLDKCSFAQPSIEYLGHTLSASGISKGSSKLQAVLDMPPPHDVSSLRSFLGHVTFYNKFLPPSLSKTLHPFYHLLKKEVKWQWSKAEQEAFKEVKSLLSSDSVLVHYNPDLPLGLSTDASIVGIGAVLFHRYPDGSERPIYNISKCLSETQKRYGMVQLEALAIIYALKKFHQFVYGRSFILVVDHKPLLSLFGPSKSIPAMAANRLARWALTLAQYDYTIEYRESKKHGNVDALSRLPAHDDKVFDQEEQTDDGQTVLMINWIGKQVNDKSDTFALVSQSEKDDVIQAAIRYVNHGWPVHISKDQQELRILRANRNALSVEGKCLFAGHRIVIPRSLRERVLEILHQGHFGMQRMKQLARSAVYWPSIDNDIEEAVRICATCAEFATKPPPAAVHPWMLPEKPWSRVHIDHAIQFKGHEWLLIVDAFSKYPCIHPVSSVSSKATIAVLDIEFAHFGYPHALVSDNSSSFTSSEFQEWLSDRNIVHLTGAPYHPATNGQVERMVQSFKRFMVKSDLPLLQALQQFQLIYRRTPLASGRSPSELLNGRQIRGPIDLIFPNLTSKRQAENQLAVTPSTSRPVRRFGVGQDVFAADFRGSQVNWVHAKVSEAFGSLHYDVQLDDGSVWRRHVNQLKRCPNQS